MRSLYLIFTLFFFTSTFLLSQQSDSLDRKGKWLLEANQIVDFPQSLGGRSYDDYGTLRLGFFLTDRWLLGADLPNNAVTRSDIVLSQDAGVFTRYYLNPAGARWRSWAEAGLGFDFGDGSRLNYHLSLGAERRLSEGLWFNLSLRSDNPIGNGVPSLSLDGHFNVLFRGGRSAEHAIHQLRRGRLAFTGRPFHLALSNQTDITSRNLELAPGISYLLTDRIQLLSSVLLGFYDLDWDTPDGEIFINSESWEANLFVGGRYYLARPRALNPFVGVGFRTRYNSFDLLNRSVSSAQEFSDSGWRVQGEFEAGASWFMNKSVSLDLGLRLEAVLDDSIRESLRRPIFLRLHYWLK